MSAEEFVKANVGLLEYVAARLPEFQERAGELGFLDVGSASFEQVDAFLRLGLDGGWVDGLDRGQVFYVAGFITGANK